MSESPEKRKVYFNDGQRELMFIGANTETVIASRRFGKSDGIIAPRWLRNAQHMPRSAGAFYAATFQQALSRTIPAAIHALSRWGFRNETHFYVGRKAPKSAGFKIPYIEPQSWDHVVHWYNGSITHILSQDVKFSANSLTLDYLLIDEGRSINPDKLFTDVIPAVSGMVGHFNKCPWHKGITIVSDMPQGKQGEWILQREKLMDKELIQILKGTIYEIQRMKEKNNPNIKNHIQSQEKELVWLRKNAHIFRKFDAIDNLELLGEEYIRKMKRELTPLVFQVSIMNRRITKLINGFYPSLEPKIHYYDGYDNTYINNQRTKEGSLDFSKIKGSSYHQDSDVDKDGHLIIAFDYNANINWITTGQVDGSNLKTLSSFYVKNGRKIRELVNDWCDYYYHHPVKNVIYYYDETALQGAYATDDESFADIVQAELMKRGWTVDTQYIGKPMKHALKHQYIDDALKGIKYLFPMFNRNNNEFLLPALEQTGIKIGRNGFEKDKSGEKLPETDEDPLELRTDGTDAWDTLFIGCNFYPVQYFNSGMVGSVFT